MAPPVRQLVNRFGWSFVIALQLVMPSGERWGFIHRYHESIFAGRLCVSRTVCRLLDRVYWPGLSEDVISYLASCLVCWRGSLCAPMGHVLLVTVGVCYRVGIYPVNPGVLVSAEVPLVPFVSDHA